ncbi:polysaccharide deacetylase family protein [Aneurinibacillus uraniidurans]|uniref:polysaccharide deacetylase family protein n=1 Tax=Aneurinibacillus uraniidurans TaxID=2966586 RepID=UPI00234A8286|nr:polysaccharide deacetylase family protein [Aneurinibacillus sp. B1]WCN36532.1 polysaccharide deacetylase family protein [Aneurinibacillus sp. B1]
MNIRIISLLVLSFILFVGNGSAAYAGKRTRAYWEATGDIIWDVSTTKKYIALTFDDGPHPLYTKQIMAALEKHHAHATFFVVGQRVERHPDLVQQMKKQGHEIANHTYNHPSPSRIKGAELENEIRRTDTVIEQTIGQKPILFRPPGGQYSEKVVKAAKAAGGHRIIMWSWTQDTKDWANPRAAKIAEHVCRNARPGNIVLMHDFGRDRTQTVQAVETILDRLEKEGFQFVTVSQLLSERGK